MKNRHLKEKVVEFMIQELEKPTWFNRTWRDVAEKIYNDLSDAGYFKNPEKLAELWRCGCCKNVYHQPPDRCFTCNYPIFIHFREVMGPPNE